MSELGHSRRIGIQDESAAPSAPEICLSKVILFGERSLRRALSEYVHHFHAERNHKGRAMSCCSLGVRTSATGLFNAGSDWADSCVFIIARQRDGGRRLR